MKNPIISFNVPIGPAHILLKISFDSLEINYKREYVRIIPDLPEGEGYNIGLFTKESVADGVIYYKINKSSKSIMKPLKGMGYKVQVTVFDKHEKQYISNQISLDDIL